ncbi:hypothetical protein BKA83DRAFT_4462579 [Pisolithus microcarpus]|nr:hypothetical protein BKA83DRAFT_4462579 [Pisolithus microcarpus]
MLTDESVADGVAANNVDGIHIEYHPNAGILPQEIPFAEAYKPDMSTDPWYPFRSHLDFKFAELALEVALNTEQVNHLLCLMKSVCSMGKVFTLSKYNDLQSTWQAASHCMMAFMKEVVCINNMDGELQEFTVYCHSLWDWACGLLKHPSIRPHFVFDVQHLSKFNGSSFIRFINKPWMADEFWNIQVLPFILYADKVKLSSFWWQKGYPIIACLTNLPISIQNGEGIGGGHVIGWLPIVKETKEHSGRMWFADFKNAVWHKSFRKLLQTIEKESRTGCWVNCWDGIPHCFFPIVLILSADYEEQAVMALIRGVKSNFPCPICLIPCNHISDFPAQFELQTSKNIVKVLEDTCSQDTQEKKEQILIQQGLHDVDSTFTVVANMDVYHTLSWDQLHANFSGKFGDHLWTELLRILDKAGCQTMAMVEKNFSEMPCWHMLNHFDEALLISYTDGQKFEDLSKIVVFACHDVLLQNMEKEGYLLLHLLELHMMHMIAAGWESLSTFNALMQKYAQKTDNMKKNWNFLKNHMHMHVFDNIEAKGVTRNFNTKPNEKMHGPLKEKYQKHTNFKNIAQQEDFFHVRLGSRVKQPLALGAVKQRSMIDKAFTQFQAKLNELLNRYFETTGKPLLGSKHIQFQVENEITEYRYIKVNFKSMTDWCQYTDHLQCNLSFHGHSYIFGQLIFLFQCVVGDETFPLALVQPYNAPTGPRLAKDVHLNLWRVCEQPRESAEIFSVHSIIHGALLYPDHTRLGKHFVVDTIDTDMFLHVQMMHKAAGHH